MVPCLHDTLQHHTEPIQGLRLCHIQQAFLDASNTLVNKILIAQVVWLFIGLSLLHWDSLAILTDVLIMIGSILPPPNSHR